MSHESNSPIERGALSPCWSCKGPVIQRALFCSTCAAVQGPGVVDHFTRLGMSRSFDVDMVTLDHNYFDLQRRLHPDRFSGRTARERALSQSQAVAVNDAYETLKDPLKRAAYMLSLEGRKVDIHGTATIDDPELLMEAMEMREALADAETRAAIDKVAARAEAQVLTCQCALSTAFGHRDLDRAGALTTRLKYLGKLAEEARARKFRLIRPVA
ncbi:MAG: Fe-S protein assembly co-chaperone HscB [Alphaproteobacteria bacterium]|nr:Fe-S protein assembly co-chaperone HscB [Alphaproteobacteria bacterium]